MVECPKCDRELQNLKGLYGHLKFKHRLEGEELDRVYAREKEEQRDKQRLEKMPTRSDVQQMIEGEVETWFGSEDRGELLKELRAVKLDELSATGEPSTVEPEKTRDPVIRKLDAYRRARDRRIALEEIGEHGPMSKPLPLLSSEGAKAKWKRWQELYERCKREEEAAEEELREAVQQSAREDRAEEIDEAA